MFCKAIFYDKYSDDVRIFTVEALNEDEAATKAIERADKEGWSNDFRLHDVYEISGLIKYI